MGHLTLEDTSVTMHCQHPSSKVIGLKMKSDTLMGI